jgi:putative membrane protein
MRPAEHATMMRSVRNRQHESPFRVAVAFAAGLAVLVGLSGTRLKESVATWSLVGHAAAQQADRVVPPAAIAGRMAPVDEAFALFIASSSLAQIEGARLVLRATKSADMTELAQRLVRDHTEALDRLRGIAAQRGLDLPQAATGRHADLVTKLAGVAPSERDEAFIQRFGLDAHKEAIALTERHVKEAQDPELKRYAEQTLDMLREHMSAARKLAYAASAR